MAPPATGTVLVLGSINVDMTLRVPRLPGTGETLIGDDARLTPGGKGANQAVAAALTGARVKMAGRIGADGHAPAVRAALDAATVDTTLVLPAGAHPTGMAVVLVDDDADNSIIVAPGANHAVDPDAVEALRDEIAAADVLLLQMEIPVDAVTRAVEVAAEVGTDVIVNLAPAGPLTAATMAKVAVLVVNETEAEYLLGHPVSTRDDLLTGAARLQRSGPGVVVVTAGSAGAVLADGTRTEHIPARRVEVVDSAGAGDAFVGALAARLAAGDTVESAARHATRVAAIAVGTPGAQLVSTVDQR